MDNEDKTIIGSAHTVVYYKNHEPLLMSVMRNTFTFLIVGLCVWVSKDSAWWTLVTGVLFLAFTWGRVSTLLKKDRLVFYSKEELKEWVDSLPVDETTKTK